MGDFLNFLSGKDLSEVMRYISMAFLTVMIPLGVALLDKEKNDVLDRYVFLDHIIKMKFFAWTLLGLTVPFLLWEYVSNISNNVIIRNLELYSLFCIWFFSIYFIFSAFIKIYRWLKKKDIEQYVGYLKSLNSKEDAPVAWGEIWKRENENWLNEKKFFSVFAKNIDDFFKRDISIAMELLRTFDQFIEKRNIFFLAGTPEVFPKILEWHYKAWDLEYDWLIKDEKEKQGKYLYYGAYSELLRVLDDIIEKIEKRVLSEGDAHSFFEYSRKHAEKYKDKKKQKENHTYFYLENLSLQRSFFESIHKSKEAYDIENHYFPPDWKVSTENIKKNSLIDKIWFNRFLDWARDKIDNPQNENNDHINKVIGIIFPRIHTIYFPYVLVFVIRSWMDNRRMESLIDNPPKFGGYYHYPLLDTSRKSEKDLDEERERNWETSKNYTIKLSILLFRSSFREANKYIEELKVLELKYKNDKKKEYLRKELLGIFERIDTEMKKLS